MAKTNSGEHTLPPSQIQKAYTATAATAATTAPREPAAGAAALFGGGVLGPGAAAGDPEGAEMVLFTGAGAGAFFAGAGAGAGAFTGALAGTGAMVGAALGARCAGAGAGAGEPLGAWAVAATARTAKMMTAMAEREADIVVAVCWSLRREEAASRAGVVGSLAAFSEGFEAGEGCNLKRVEIMFNYAKGLHTVVEVSAAEYMACTATNPINSDSSGATTMPLKTPGSHYYVCSIPGALQRRHEARRHRRWFLHAVANDPDHPNNVAEHQHAVHHPVAELEKNLRGGGRTRSTLRKHCCATFV
ncbi:hypothetical protein EJB05_20124, partial [Eragrostis curvula]